MPAQDKHGNSILHFISTIRNIISDHLSKLDRTLGILLVRNCTSMFLNIDVKIV